MLENNRYIKLVRSLQDWCLGAGTYGAFCSYLGYSTSECYELLVRNGLADVTGKALDTTSPQDVINLVLLSGTIRLHN